VTSTSHPISLSCICPYSWSSRSLNIGQPNLQTTKSLNRVSEVDVVDLDIATNIQLRGVGFACVQRLPADDCDADLSLSINFREGDAGGGAGAAGYGFIRFDCGFDGGFLGGGHGDYLHDGGVWRVSQCLLKGEGEERRTDDFLGCVGDELHEVDCWLSSENGLEIFHDGGKSRRVLESSLCFGGFPAW
jgi:hypothetical protein